MYRWNVRALIVLGAIQALGGMMTMTAAAAPRIEVMSVTSSGAPADQNSSGGGGICDVGGTAQISGDGRYVAFVTVAFNLANQTPDFWLVRKAVIRDRVAKKTIVVAPPLAGAPRSGWESCSPKLARNGRYVLFDSGSGYMVADDRFAGRDCFVRDLTARTTALVSLSSAGVQGNADCYASAISANGRFVLFRSRASNLVARDSNGSDDIFLRDLQTRRTTRVSVGTGGAQATGWSTAGLISNDGRYVAFQSNANGLAPNDNDLAQNVFLHDRMTNKTIPIDLVAGKRTSGGEIATMSDDGRYIGVSFYYSMSYVYDRASNKTTALLPTAPAGIRLAGMSSTGRYVTFTTRSPLVGSDRNGIDDAYVRDRTTGVTRLASITPGGVQGTGWGSGAGGVSNDGSVVVFESTDNFVPADRNPKVDVFVRVD